MQFKKLAANRMVAYNNNNSCNQQNINKLGLGRWAKSKAAEVRKTWFTKPWTLTEAHKIRWITGSILIALGLRLAFIERR